MKLKFGSQGKHVKAKLPAENAVYDDFSKKIHVIFKKFLLLF